MWLNGRIKSGNADFEELQSRTKRFALRIVKLYRSLPKFDEARILGKQLLRSGTSIRANYGAACRARSRAEFVAKLGIASVRTRQKLLLLQFDF
jgi:four helix bundle protein